MPEIKERPILFQAPMVRSILAGEKTVTRRAIRTKLTDRFDEPRGDGDVHAGYPFVECNGDYRSAVCFCPYGQPGDRLWVRESWEDVHPVQVSNGRYSQEGRAGIPGPPGVTYQTIYRADGPYPKVFHTHKHPYRTLEPDPDHGFKGPADNGYTGWTPSIHMPRWASRILLEIIEVRVERLQAISDEQCVAEGCGLGPAAIGVKLTVPPGASMPQAMFAELWKSINGADAWDANPWVWVVEFKRVMP